MLFFFQAEDGIRDHCVTGVQTCALPIFRGRDGETWESTCAFLPVSAAGTRDGSKRAIFADRVSEGKRMPAARPRKIGRASCRERVESSGSAGPLQNKERKQTSKLLHVHS